MTRDVRYRIQNCEARITIEGKKELRTMCLSASVFIFVLLLLFVFSIFIIIKMHILYYKEKEKGYGKEWVGKGRVEDLRRFERTKIIFRIYFYFHNFYLFFN